MSLRLQSTAAKSNSLPVMLIGGRVVPALAQRQLKSLQLRLGRAVALMYKQKSVHILQICAPALVSRHFGLLMI